jgi:hypothetical protein
MANLGAGRRYVHTILAVPVKGEPVTAAQVQKYLRSIGYATSLETVRKDLADARPLGVVIHPGKQNTYSRRTPLE